MAQNTPAVMAGVFNLEKQMSKTPDEPYFYHTIDPEAPFKGCPAVTTLLFKVCDNNYAKFDEATRLIHLFILKDRELRQK